MIYQLRLRTTYSLTVRQKYPQLISVLVLVFVVYNRRREAQIKYPNPDDDVRENIINYEDEGGGEDDMTAFDITPLQIPVAAPDAAAVAAMSTLQRQKMKNCEFSQHSIRGCVTMLNVPVSGTRK